MHFSDWKIRTKLGVTLALVVALTALLGSVALWQMGRMHHNTLTMGQETLPSVAEAGNIRAQWNRYRRLESLLLLPQTAPQAQALAQQAASVLQLLQTSEAKLAALPHPQEGQALLNNYQQLRQTFMGHSQRFIPAALAYHTDGSADPTAYAALSTMYLQDVEPHFAALAEASGKFSNFSQQYAQQLNTESSAVRSSAQWWVIAGMAFSAALAALLAWLLTRAITQPTHDAVQAVTRIAQGDLTHAVVQRSQDEMGQLMGAVEHMRTTLNSIVQRVRQNADTVAGASHEISSGTADLSARTENQASALEETASAMEQLAATVRQNADSAQAANQLALNASQLVTQGGQVVQQVVQNMHSISDSSRRISDIIGVIDSIAFQTNILALNAAVEAARAGEQGRGFAVVASEVRTLAGRSANAAKEIKQLIQDSAQRVAEGSTLVERAGSTMTEVEQATRSVSDLVKEISAASTEQSQGVSQVGEAITQMDSATQQNAALVEESAAAAHSLQQQAQALVQAMSHFQTAAGTGVAHPAHSQRSPALAPAGLAPRSTTAAAHTKAPAALPQRTTHAAAPHGDDWDSF